MILTERHIITKQSKDWKQIDYMSFISKNLYNQAIYYIKNTYKETGKYLRYKQVESYLRKENSENYVILPNNTSQQILMLVDKNIKSFFALLRKWKKNKKTLSGCPKFPKYKDKLKGRNILIFTSNQCKIKNGILSFPKKMNISSIKTNVKKLQQVRIVPQTGCYVIEILYKFEEVNYELNKENYLSIDLGINNICAIITNQPGLQPILINGKQIKSFNAHFNKLLAKEQSQLKKNHNKNMSNKIEKMYLYKSNWVRNYFHNISKYIIQYCIDNEIGNIIIGKNKEWKQNCNLGKVNNQKFIQIPYNMLISQLQYKAQMVGINVIEQEESYTSKVDHLAKEEVKHHDTYFGKRVKRGLFQSSKNVLINADVNGAVGILRKVIGDDFLSLFNTGLVANPLKVQPLSNFTKNLLLI